MVRSLSTSSHPPAADDEEEVQSGARPGTYEVLLHCVSHIPEVVEEATMKQLILALLFGAAAMFGLFLHVHYASAGSAMTVHVSLSDYMVTVAQRQLPAGKPITFVITNRGHHTHEFVLEAANAFDRAIRFDGRTYEADEIKPGTTRSVTWTIPHEGTYKLACHIDHHYQMGMKTLITAH